MSVKTYAKEGYIQDSTVLLSEETKSIKPTLTGSSELGFLYRTGNSRSADIKTGGDLRFEKGRWLSLLSIDLLIKKADKANADTGSVHFKTTDQKWAIASQTNYSLASGEKNYIYANIWYEESEFSSFNKQSSISTGWGRHWYKSNEASLWGDIGPGFKRDQFRTTAQVPAKIEESWILQIQALYVRKLNEHVEIKQFISAKQSMNKGENSIYRGETSITASLISTLQLKFSYTVSYNTNTEEDKKNLDSQTAVTLVYSF